MRRIGFTNLIILAAIGYLALVLQFAFGKNVSLYYLLPIVLLMLFLLASIRLPQFYKVRVLLVLFSVGSVLFVFELVLEIREYNDAQDDLQLTTALWEQKDLRSWRQIVKEMRASGLDAYSRTSPGALGPNGFDAGGTQIFPLGHISQSPIFLCNDNAEAVVYESDRHGFVNPRGLWGREDLDIVAIGDSFTQGICVRTDRNAVALIREAYPNTINLGLAGTGPFVHYAVLKEYAGSLEPKLVLWFFYEGNDFHDLDGQGPNKFPVLGKYFENPAFTQNLIDKQSEIDTHLAAFLEQLLGEPEKGEMELDRQRQIADANRAATIRGAFTSLIRFRSLGQRTNNLLNRIRGAGHNVDSNDFANLRIMLQASKEHVASWNGHLYFVYLPAWSRYREPPNVYLNPLREQVVQLARDLNIPVIDVADEFDAHPDPLSLWPYRQFGHYNEDGYQLVAETVLRSISLPE